MITITTASIKEFQKRAAFITRDTLRPILSNLLLSYKGANFYLTKNNINHICTAPVEATLDERDGVSRAPLLLDERILMNYVSGTKSATIDVTRKEDKIFIDDGVMPIYLPYMDPTDYPKPPEEVEPDGALELSPEVMTAIGIAKHFVMDDANAGNFRFVHVDGEFISGFQGGLFYVNNQFAGLPTIMLTREQADIITAAAPVTFKDVGNQYYFWAGAATYVFTKSEGKAPNLTSTIQRLVLPGKEFTVDKAALVDFCGVAAYLSADATVTSTLTPVDRGQAELVLDDASFNRGGRRAVSFSGDFDPITLNTHVIAGPLAAVPYEKLLAKTIQNTLIITGKNEYFCFIGSAKI